MRINRATSTVPKDPRRIEQNVMYISPHKYKLEGRYRLYITGKAKLGGVEVTSGMYTGIGQDGLVLEVPEHAGVMFDRYPYPLPKRITPAPVADIKPNVTTEQRVAQMMVDTEERLRNERLTQAERDNELHHILHDFLSDEDPESEFIPSDYGLIDMHQDLPPADPTTGDVEIESEKTLETPEGLVGNGGETSQNEPEGVPGPPPASTLEAKAS